MLSARTLSKSLWVQTLAAKIRFTILELLVARPANNRRPVSLMEPECATRAFEVRVRGVFLAPIVVTSSPLPLTGAWMRARDTER